MVKLYKTAGCTGTQVAQGTAAKFASPGITVSVPDNSTTSFRAKARDAAGNVSPCSNAAPIRRGLDPVRPQPRRPHPSQRVVRC